MLLWIVLTAVIIAAVFLIEFEKWTATTLCLVSTIGLWFWLSGTNFFTWIAENWTAMLAYVGIYLVIGVIWSFVKWFSFLVGFRDKYAELKAKDESSVKKAHTAWFRQHKLNPNGQVPEQLQTEYDQYMRTEHWTPWRGESHYYGNPLDRRPQASENKSRIVAWISFWPFSLVGTLFNDPIRKLINWIFNSLKDTYQAMSNRVLPNIPEMK